MSVNKIFNADIVHAGIKYLVDNDLESRRKHLTS